MFRLNECRRSACQAAVLFVGIAFLTSGVAHAQLRVVSFNTATGSTGSGVQTARPGTDIVLTSIGEQLRSGIAKPIDVLLLQEQFSNAVSTQSFVDLLDGIYGAGTYARGNLDALTSSPDGQGGGPAIVYNTQTVQLLQEIRFGNVGGSAQARSTLRYRLRPVGYDIDADFFVYNNHYKAGESSNDQTRRDIEAKTIRNHTTYGSNALVEGTHIIYAGDHNFYRSSEAAFQSLTLAGNGQAFDPVDRVGTWTNNSSFADVHTQSPCATSCSLVSGGMDDRFDFQLVTSEFLDDEGLSYIDGSYHAFGNNGTTYNTNINSGSNTYVFSGVSSYSKSQILNALWSVSDHLPVVADYQVPAIMEAIAGSVPSTLDVGQTFQLDVTVSNIADVVAAIGADELDYSLTTSGDLSGEFLDQVDMALGVGNTHMVTLDTSTPGMKSGMITLASTSQAVMNGLINIPINFEVLAAGVPGDYNDDGIVDAADYVVWRANVGSETMLPNDSIGGTIGDDHYTQWRSNFGQSAESGGGSSELRPVPEPGSGLLLLLGVCLAAAAQGRLKG